MLFPLGSNSVDDIFGNYPWDLEEWYASCQNIYGTQTRPEWENVNYGLYTNIVKQLRYASNIVFTNGLMDPWSGGGILDPVDNPDILVLTMATSSHHAELRTPNINDPQDVAYVRG